MVAAANDFFLLLDVGSHTSDSASSQRSSAAVSLRSIASLPSQTSRTSLDQDSFHVFTPRYDSLRSSIASSAALGETFATSHPVSDNIPLQALKGPLSKRNQPLPLKYFCTFCKKRFARKESWKSHEAEFHDWQEEYTCKFANCQEKFHRKYRFDRHHQNQHGCKKGCSCADVCRVDLPKKVAWGCGYCGIYLGTWQHRQEHIGAVHYDEEDKDKSNWQHTFVIWGLLSQPHTVAAWRSILASNFGDSLPCCTWSSEAACELQARLEWPGWTADQLVTEAFRLLDPISIPVGLRSDTAAWTNAPAYGTPDGTDTSVVENMVDTLGKESRGPNLSTTLAHIADSRIAASANVSYSPHLGDQAFRPVSFNTTPPLPAPFHMGVYDPSVRSKTPTQQLAQRLNPRKALPKRGKVTHSEQTSDRLGSFMNLD